MVAGAVAAGRGAEPVSDTLGLLEEAMQVARDLGYRVREEPLGELPGGACAVGGQRQILLNAAHPSSQRLDTLLDVLAADADVGDQPVSHLLESRLRRHRSGHRQGHSGDRETKHDGFATPNHAYGRYQTNTLVTKPRAGGSTDVWV